MLIQKFHPGLRLAQQLALASSGAPLFSRQGNWDGGSTLHCVAMALALLGKLSDPVDAPYHTSGNEHIVWDHAWPHYLHGLTLSELASFIAELNLGVQPVVRSGSVSDLLQFVAAELSLGRSALRVVRNSALSRRTRCCCSIRPATSREWRDSTRGSTCTNRIGWTTAPPCVAHGYAGGHRVTTAPGQCNRWRLISGGVAAFAWRSSVNPASLQGEPR